MLVAVILGYRLNDDGTMAPTLVERLQMAIKLNNAFNPDKIVLSGGVANAKAGVSEAQRMHDYLVAQGVESSKLVVEDKSMTTKQNAEFSVPIACQLGATEILLCSSLSHVTRWYLNPISLFKRQLKQHPQIKLSVFTE